MAAKGMIFLDARSAILHEQLFPRILEGKRERCEITFADFDDVAFKISCQPESENVVKVNMLIRGVEELRRLGSDDLLNNLFPGLVANPDPGYNVAIEFNCDNIQNPEVFLNNICQLKRHVIGGPLDRAFTALLNKTSDSLQSFSVSYRKNEAMYVCPIAGKVTVIFLIDFEIPTDKAIARVFLQEFVEAQRTNRAAPPVSFSNEPPKELASLITNFNPTSVGFISFALEDRHVKDARKDIAISLLCGFRNYLHYHIKCSKTYLHMRMRKRVAGWLQVLNRANPDEEKEKKNAQGKSFVRPEDRVKK